VIGSTSLKLPATPGSIPLARDKVVGLVEGCDDRVADDLRLLVTELFTNSVRHAGLTEQESIEIRVDRRDGALVVSILDGGRGFRSRPAPDGGWGLLLLSKIAARWGVDEGRDGTAVWFELRP
jgi:two-component sensor histidine kinase